MKRVIESEIVVFLKKMNPQMNLDLSNHHSSLFEHNVLDSFGVIELLTFLEGRYNIQFGDKDLVREKFENISSLADLVLQKKPNLL